MKSTAVDYTTSDIPHGVWCSESWKREVWEGSGSVMDLGKKAPTSIFQPCFTIFDVAPALSPYLEKANWWRCIQMQQRGALWPLENNLWVNLLDLVEHSLLTSGLRHSAVGWLHGRRPSCCQPPPSPPQNVGRTRTASFACGSSFHQWSPSCCCPQKKNSLPGCVSTSPCQIICCCSLPTAFSSVSACSFCDCGHDLWLKGRKNIQYILKWIKYHVYAKSKYLLPQQSCVGLLQTSRELKQKHSVEAHHVIQHLRIHF